MSIDALAQQLGAGDAWQPLAFGIAFLGGLAAGLGPCVLPMVPAVFGYVTGHVSDAEGTSPVGRGLALSAVFVTGMSLVFATVGAVAGVLGHALIAQAWAYYAVAAICVVVGLQLLGAIELPLDRLNRWLPARRPSRGGFLGALILGMLFGVVVSPCSTPILGAIATVAAAAGSAANGAALLFVFGIGKGMPLLLLGVASGSITFLGHVSRLVPTMNKIGGVGMLVAAAYLIWLA